MSQLSSAHERRSFANFFSGVSALTVSTVLVKVIGLLYRVPMLDRLGSEGMGYFNTAYEVYALLCVLATAGLPVAMSVLIAAAPGQYPTAHAAVTKRIFHVALWLFLAIGILGCLLLWMLALPISRLLGNPAAAPSLRAIAPTVLLICLSGAFRGYAQGQGRMAPTAVSQVIEALGKLLLGLTFAGYAKARGADLPYVAAAAVLGLTVGTGLSVVYLALRQYRTTRTRVLPAPPSEPLPGSGDILRRLLCTAVPVTVSAGVISLTKCLDLALILRRMQDAGLSAGEANALYGCYSTLAVPVFNVLPSLTTAVAMTAVPALSEALARRRRATGAAEVRAATHDVKRTASVALSLTLWLAVPAGLGVCVFADDILRLLFAGQPAAAALATPWLRLLGLSVPSACLITVTGAFLQATGHAGRPIISMLIGTGAKTVLAYILLGIPSLGLLGAPISSLVCDTLILSGNLLFLMHDAPDLLPGVRRMLRPWLEPTALAVLSALPALWVASRWVPTGMPGTAGRPAASVGVVCMAGIYAIGTICMIKMKKKKHLRTMERIQKNV